MTSTRKKVMAAGALCLLMLLALAPSDAAAQAETRVRFRRGQRSKTVSGVVTANGRGGDFVLGARAGQTLVIDFAAKGETVFALTAPDGENMAGEGSPAGRVRFKLMQTGDYHISVINRDNRRRKFTFTFTIR